MSSSSRVSAGICFIVILARKRGDLLFLTSSSIFHQQKRGWTGRLEGPVSIRYRWLYSSLPREGDPRRAEQTASTSNCPALLFGSRCALCKRPERLSRSRPPLYCAP